MTTSVRPVLQSKLDDLDHELGVMSAPVAPQSGISFGKRVGDGTAMAVERLSQVAAHDRLRALREDVVRALAKEEGGSYGRCDVCDEAIPAERLEALPWAVRCVGHTGRS